ncbi:ribose 5-phosphate isomerase B [Nitratifractor sp.]|uniref:ribose 5-phosphate isomerase B n=1 Tax=Nitratifractor sp. TaxID=2268144 RepID=UPI0025DA2DCD|nr:ribose 5-phosphate isomerase B [Nitratifractor sp.]
MKFYIATDHAGFHYKAQVIDYVRSKGHEIIDLGPETADRVDYPDYGRKCAEAVKADPGSFGIVICGTGIGISIAANKVPGIRAATCHDAYTARMARAHNNAQILGFGERVVGMGVVQSMIDAFIETSFEGGRHERRVEKIDAIDAFYKKEA